MVPSSAGASGAGDSYRGIAQKDADLARFKDTLPACTVGQPPTEPCRYPSIGRGGVLSVGSGSMLADIHPIALVRGLPDDQQHSPESRLGTAPANVPLATAPEVTAVTDTTAEAVEYVGPEGEPVPPLRYAVVLIGAPLPENK